MTIELDDDDSYLRQIKVESRRVNRRSMVFLSAIFLVIMIVTAILQSDQILFVLLFYASVFFEIICLSAFVMLSEVKWSVESLGSLSRGKNSTGKITRRDILNSINVFVKYGSKGSIHSRREIAAMLSDIIEKLELGSSSLRSEKLVSDQEFQSDLDKIIHSYSSRKDSEALTGTKPIRFTKEEREDYLISLERLVTRLGER